MTRRSLRLRLVLAASALIALALALAGFGLVLIFDRVLDARTTEDLDRTGKFLAGQVTRGRDGALALSAEPPDPRFATPYGGLYWQIDGRDGDGLQSRSLWDKRLTVPAASGADASPSALTGPDGGRLVAVTRRVLIGRGESQEPLTITVAMDRRELAGSRARYLSLLVPSLLALGLVLALAMALFVSRALAPFRALRADLRAIHEGRRATLPARFPDEVQPLVDDLNRLIGVQERALARARTQAGDLAHGLKTPLAVLSAVARRAQDDRPDLARDVEEQARAMQAQVERTLARARITPVGALQRRHCQVAPVVERLVDAMKRLPEGDSLTWNVSLPRSLMFPGDTGELTEMLGNLLDNARKWAHRHVQISGNHTDAIAILVIEDDGPGMTETAMTRIARGQRWDEIKSSTGFGLAIAADLAEETGAKLMLDQSPLGGLRARLEWRAHDQDGTKRDR